MADSRQTHASLWVAMDTAAATPDELLELDYHFCCASDMRQGRHLNYKKGLTSVLCLTNTRDYKSVKNFS